MRSRLTFWWESLPKAVDTIPALAFINEGEVLAPDAGRDQLQRCGRIPESGFSQSETIIGISALAGIVTRDSIMLVDFVELAIRHGRSLFDAILESPAFRLRPILLTAGAALLSSIPITPAPMSSGPG